MNVPFLGSARTLLFAILALCAFGLTPSCNLLSSAGMPKEPAEEWVEGSRATYDAIAPRFIAYVNADATLSITLKHNLLYALADWEYMIRRGEEVYGGPVSGPPPPPPPPPPSADANASPGDSFASIMPGGDR